jgi:hypothetical protein
LKTHRISTTISQKHWELLKKHAGEFETQQKALERALECLENDSKQSQTLTEEEKLCMHLIQAKLPCLIERDCLKLLIETVDFELYNEFVTRNKPIEYVIEQHFQKPLKECSLKEIIDGLIINCRISNWFDTVDYTDESDRYILKITHRLGPNTSKIVRELLESVFKTYGVKVESTISAGAIFIKTFKN